mgnify:CR=1 FL=1
MRHGRAADHVILHVVQDHAIFLRREVRQHVADVGGIQRAGLCGHPAGEIGVADHGHAVVGHDLLVRHRQVAVAAAFRRKVNDHRPRLHHAHHVLGPQLRRGPAGDERRGDDDILLGDNGTLVYDADGNLVAFTGSAKHFKAALARLLSMEYVEIDDWDKLVTFIKALSGKVNKVDISDLIKESNE